MPLLVRAWNVFHGNADPPRRQAFLEEMVRLVSADGPDLVCLQEVPVWALRELERWSGMRSYGAVAARPRLRSARLGRLITELDHGLFRSAFTGQANAILVASAHDVTGESTRVVSRSGERRVVQAVRLETGVAVVNFHVTGGVDADAQLRAVAEFASEQGSRVVLAGDANLRPGEGTAYGLLRERGFSAPLAGSIDQILVRGLPVSILTAWPEERRRTDGLLLSDHAPVELSVG